MKIRACISDQLPLRGKGIRFTIFQGEGPAGSRDAIEFNLSRIERVVESARKHGTQLISFPELYLSGYALTPGIAHELAMEINCSTLEKVSECAAKHDMGIICPYPEKAHVSGETRYYDSIALFDENGSLLKNYRKTHLWGPDEKKIWNLGYEFPEEGEAFTVHHVHGFPIGLLNCYEAEFPELARILALGGAKLIVIPTAADISTKLSTGKWTVVPYPDISRSLIPSHALENGIFISYCNRCREETIEGQIVGRFLGNSVVADPHGGILSAAANEETLLITDCVPSDYGPTHPEDTYYLHDRRPELYSALVQKISPTRKI